MVPKLFKLMRGSCDAEAEGGSEELEQADAADCSATSAACAGGTSPRCVCFGLAGKMHNAQLVSLLCWKSS